MLDFFFVFGLWSRGFFGDGKKTGISLSDNMDTVV